jgi:hypothetical protein
MSSAGSTAAASHFAANDKMPKKLGWSSVGLCGLAMAVLLAVANCSRLPPTGSVVIPPVPLGTARIWIYRNGGPNEIHASPYLRLNGRVAGISEPDGAFYRDVTPGRYVVTVDSYLDSYVNQFASVDLAAGQEAYVKVLSMRRDRGGESAFARDIFYTRLIPADLARDAIARSPFHGGG